MQSTVLAAHHPRQNHLLGALPAADYAHLRPQHVVVPLLSDLALYEAHAHPGAQLEARACACYGVVKGESERLSLRKYAVEVS